MRAAACYLGLIVRDLARSVDWYTDTFGARVEESASSWASLELDGGSRIELTAGDPERPGLTFPSYGAEPGPPMLPGYSVDEPAEVAAGLTVARQLPDWLVVVAPDRVRVVLTRRDCDSNRGLVGFRWLTPKPAEQQEFLEYLGAQASIEAAQTAQVVPVLRGSPAGQVRDVDGNLLEVVTEGPTR